MVLCMHWYLVGQGIIDGVTKVKHLVIIADNCTGQNKNFCVLKFCCCLVEDGWAGEVTLIFLIKGHTKNYCDVKFNLLKRGAKGLIYLPRRTCMLLTPRTMDVIFILNVWHQKSGENLLMVCQTCSVIQSQLLLPSITSSNLVQVRTTQHILTSFIVMLNKLAGT